MLLTLCFISHFHRGISMYLLFLACILLDVCQIACSANCSHSQTTPLHKLRERVWQQFLESMTMHLQNLVMTNQIALFQNFTWSTHCLLHDSLDGVQQGKAMAKSVMPIKVAKLQLLSDCQAAFVVSHFLAWKDVFVSLSRGVEKSLYQAC